MFSSNSSLRFKKSLYINLCKKHIIVSQQNLTSYFRRLTDDKKRTFQQKKQCSWYERHESRRLICISILSVLYFRTALSIIRRNIRFRRPCPLYIPHIRLFLNLAKHMEKLDDISKFLVKTVDKAEEKGILTRLSQNENTEDEVRNSRTHRLARYSRDIYFDDSDIPYEYTEDHSIDRNLPSREFKITPLIINLDRCLFAMEDSYNFFARLIANFLLLKEETPNFSMLEAVPSYVKRALNNNRKVAFLGKALNLTKKRSFRRIRAIFRLHKNNP